MWKKGKSGGALGVKSLIKQTKKELKMEGVDLVLGNDKANQIDNIPFENIELKEEINDKEMELVSANIKVRETIHKSIHYILFSKPAKQVSN